MGGQQVATRGGMIHLVLTLCRQFEDAFAKAIDGGKGGEPPAPVPPRQLLTPPPAAGSSLYP